MGSSLPACDDASDEASRTKDLFDSISGVVSLTNQIILCLAGVAGLIPVAINGAYRNLM